MDPAIYRDRDRWKAHEKKVKGLRRNELMFLLRMNAKRGLGWQDLWVTYRSHPLINTISLWKVVQDANSNERQERVSSRR